LPSSVKKGEKPVETKKIQFVLVSEQPTPNLSPLVDASLKPDEVVLVTTPEQVKSGRAEWLAEVIKTKGIDVHFAPISTAWEYEIIKNELEEQVSRFQDDKVQLVFNITGGTKLMSIAAYELFFFDNKGDVFYVQNDTVFWIHSSKEEKVKNHPLEDRLKLNDFLTAHGASIKEMDQSGTPGSVKELGESWLDRAEMQSAYIRKLNGYAFEAERKLKVSLKEEDYEDQELIVLINELEIAGMVSLEGKELIFKNEAARFFVNGGWLEEVIYNQLQKLFKEEPIGAQDMAKNLLFVWKGENKETGTKNELDIVFLYNNRLHIIECKTKVMTRNDNDVSDALNKLNTLKQKAGGLASKAMLISYQEVRKNDKERADLMGVKLCDKRGLKSLKSHLKRFISEG
jgi:hypothetical protein